MKILICYQKSRYSAIIAGVFIKMFGKLVGFERAGHEVYALFMSLNQQKLCQFSHGRLVDCDIWQPITTENERAAFGGNAVETIKLPTSDCLLSD